MIIPGSDASVSCIAASSIFLPILPPRIIPSAEPRRDRSRACDGTLRHSPPARSRFGRPRPDASRPLPSAPESSRHDSERPLFPAPPGRDRPQDHRPPRLLGDLGRAGRVLRLLHLRLCGGKRLPAHLLPEHLADLGADLLVPDLRRRFPGPPARGLPVRTFRRPGGAEDVLPDQHPDRRGHDLHGGAAAGLRHDRHGRADPAHHPADHPGDRPRGRIRRRGLPARGVRCHPQAPGLLGVAGQPRHPRRGDGGERGAVPTGRQFLDLRLADRHAPVRGRGGAGPPRPLQAGGFTPLRAAQGEGRTVQDAEP